MNERQQFEEHCLKASHSLAFAMSDLDAAQRMSQSNAVAAIVIEQVVSRVNEAELLFRRLQAEIKEDQGANGKS